MRLYRFFNLDKKKLFRTVINKPIMQKVRIWKFFVRSKSGKLLEVSDLCGMISDYRERLYYLNFKWGGYKGGVVIEAELVQMTSKRGTNAEVRKCFLMKGKRRMVSSRFLYMPDEGALYEKSGIHEIARWSGDYLMVEDEQLFKL